MLGVSSPIPSRYPDEIALAEEYGWTWRDTRDAPRPFVDELLTRLYARRKWEGEKRRQDESAQKAQMQANKMRRK